MKGERGTIDQTSQGRAKLQKYNFYGTSDVRFQQSLPTFSSESGDDYSTCCYAH